MNDTEREILKMLAADSRITHKAMARALQLDESAVSAAVRSLEESGVIVRYTTIVNDSESDDVEALIEVKVTPRRGHGFDLIAEEIAAHTEVVSLYLMSGAYDLAVIVKARTLKDVSRFVSEKISTYDSVISTATHFILKKYKVEGAQISDPVAAERLSVQP